jgi:hypothetical protein
MAKKVNKKKVNSNKTTYNGIKFASGLEVYAYKLIVDAKLESNLLYESKTFEIVESFEYDGKKYRNIKITPDFVDEKNKIIFEVKGRANESFPLRWKLMKKYFHDINENWKVYIGVGNQKNVKEELNKMIKYYEDSNH